MTSDGRVFNGLLAGESPTSITLNQAEGKQQMILRRNIEELKAIPVSLMPDDLRKQVSPDDFADLLSWLRRPPTQLVLLDENRDLLSALNEGSGLAQFIDQDKFVGRFSLQVTPPQRYSRRIRDWDFRIRERPGPGEYRYLRFAWKTNEGHGVMIELADNGGWPPPDRSLRRYHAGKNSSSWESVEISDEVPRQWTVVTRDLWKDFGDFTLTGFAPTAMGAAALFDRIELLQSLNQGTGDSRDESKSKQVP